MDSVSPAASLVGRRGPPVSHRCGDYFPRILIKVIFQVVIQVKRLFISVSVSVCLCLSLFLASIGAAVYQLSVAPLSSWLASGPLSTSYQSPQSSPRFPHHDSVRPSVCRVGHILYQLLRLNGHVHFFFTRMWLKSVLSRSSTKQNLILHPICRGTQRWARCGRV